MSEPISTSGYTPCACRDCMDVTVSADTSAPDLCEACRDAGCEPYRLDPSGFSDHLYYAYDCQRDDAYGDRCGRCGPDHQCPTDDLCLGCLAQVTGKGE